MGSIFKSGRSIIFDTSQVMWKLKLRRLLRLKEMDLAKNVPAIIFLTEIGL